VGLIARALEQAGIATTQTSWHSGRARAVRPPRITLTKLKRGSTLGRPGDRAQHLRVLEATLALLAQDAPLPIVELGEEME
jgi:hypothetical protein